MPSDQATVTPGNPTGWRKWLFRIAAVVLGPTVLFVLLEFGLRLGGYGYPTTFFIRTRALGQQQIGYTENVDFGRRFFPAALVRTPLPLVLPSVKAPGTVRVFVLGESAAMGVPDPSSSFSRILDVMLHDQFPQTRFEVLNTGMVAINSHVVRWIAGDCAAQQPDFFVVLLGNNEIIGPFGAAGIIGEHSPNLRAVRANLHVKQFRTGQLLGGLVDSFKPAGRTPAWNAATYAGSHVSADDPRMHGTYDNFRANLQDICQIGARAGARVLVCTVPVNLKDCPPFASLHTSGLSPEQTAAWDHAYVDGVTLEQAGRPAQALECYAAAARIDDRYADLTFRRARCLLRLKQDDAAKKHFEQARDLDALRLRSDTKINEIVRDVVRQDAPDNVQLLDAERAFSAGSPSGIPGEELFVEHVHMSFKGNYLLAALVFRGIAANLAPLGERAVGQASRLPPLAGGTPAPRTEPLNEADCAERLAYVEWNRLRVEKMIYQLLHDAPFNQQIDNTEQVQRLQAQLEKRQRQVEAARTLDVAVYEKALKNTPDDWAIHLNYAQLLTETGDLNGAIEQYGMVLSLVPHHYEAAVQLGNLLLAVGAIEPAQARFAAALRYAPELASAHLGVAKVLVARGSADAAISYLESRLNRAPDRSEALVQLAQLLLGVGRPDAARARLDEAFERHADDPDAHMTMAQLCATAGATDEALAHLDAALRSRPRLFMEVTKMRAQLRKGPSDKKSAPVR